MASDAAYLIALTNIYGIGPVGALSVARKFKTADALANASSAELDEALGDKCAGAIRNQLHNGWQSLLTKSQDVVSDHLASGIRPIAVTEDDYPPLLQSINDPPPVLYAKGNIPILKVLDAIAVIGTRKPTSSGIKVASRVARHLASSGFVVVSGLARGIDAAAHRAACDEGFTVAVLANPLDKVYPAENRQLAERIVQSGGSLVGELPIGERTYRNTFIRRDRIQSGMSLAVIPVQTDVEGGTMHTVRFAEAQRRLLFCPTPLQEESGRKEYAGVWQLLRSSRATPFQSREDYSEVISRVREYKSKLIDEYHLIDIPLPPRPKVVGDEIPDEPKESQPDLTDKARAERLEQMCRALGLDSDKKLFNAILTKVRNRLFGKRAVKKERSKEDEKQQRLMI
jgi:DNA processing protein